MQNVKGGVFFIDILGINELTNGNIPLKRSDFSAWQIKGEGTQNEHYLAAGLLQRLRNTLINARQVYKKVQFAQLSDCAFIWSTNLSQLLSAVTHVMWEVSERGLLCRAGLSYGDILQPDRIDDRLGQFVVGNAASNAVKNERAGKGARIFCDKRLVREARKDPSIAARYPIPQIKNPLDGTTIHEYQWCRYPAVSPRQKTGPQFEADKLIDLYVTFTLSPRLAWNARNESGMQQLDCTVDTITEGLEELLWQKHFLPAWNPEKPPLRSWDACEKERERLKRIAREILAARQ